MNNIMFGEQHRLERMLKERDAEVERLRGVGTELLDVAERLKPAEHSLARAQLNELRRALLRGTALEPEP